MSVNEAYGSKKAVISILNSMAGSSFEIALDQHVLWGINYLDLKDCIWGKSIVELTVDEARKAAQIIKRRSLSVYCLSTVLFGGDIELGQSYFQSNYFNRINHLIEIAKIFQPRFIRLLAAKTAHRSMISHSVDYLQQKHKWLIPLYIAAIDRIQEGYFSSLASQFHHGITIENEAHNCIFSNPKEIVDFFKLLDRPQSVALTWDVQNLWQMGTFPTIDVYYQLKDLIHYYHLKGGQFRGDSPSLYWKSNLSDASWPVVEITRQVVIDGVSPVICLNPSHGQAKSGYDYHNSSIRDIQFTRRLIREI